MRYLPLILLLLCFFLFPSSLSAQYWEKFFVGPDSTTSFPKGWSSANPLSYDPDLDVLTLTHRCDSSSTPGVWRGFQIYNILGPGDSAWTQAFPYFGSFTNTLMPDPPAGTIFKSGSDAIPIAVWTTPAKPNWLQFASDPPGEASFAGKDTLTGGDRFRLDIRTWTSENTIFWSAVVEDSSGAFKELRLYRAGDATFFSPPSFVTFDTDTHGWYGTNMLSGDAIKVGSTTIVSFVYYPAGGAQDGHTIYLLSSTNEGVTWTTESIDLADVPGLAGYPTDTIEHGGSMVLDSLGYPHCVIGYVVWPEHPGSGASDVIAEIYKDAGGWKSKVIAPMSIPNDTTGVPVLSLSRNKQGTVFVVGIEYPDIPNQWGITGRKLTSKNWKSVAKYPNWDHDNPRLASRLRYDGADNYTAFMSADIPSDVQGRSYLEVGREYVNVSPVAVDWTPFAFVYPPSGSTLAIQADSLTHVKISFRDRGENTGMYTLHCTWKVFDLNNTEVFSDTLTTAIHSDSIKTIEFPGTFIPTDTEYVIQAIISVVNGPSKLATDNTITTHVKIIQPIKIDYFTRWNLISLPVYPEVTAPFSLFPDGIHGTCWSFDPNTGYSTPSSLSVGRGYWIRLPSAVPDTIFWSGIAISSANISIKPGWNLIGSLSFPVSTPGYSNIIGSSFFGYDHGYYITTTLQPGKGYWMKGRMNGILSLSKSLNLKQSLESSLDDLSKITVNDKNGGNQALFVSDGRQESLIPEMFEMPPVPPTGNFDVRFKSQRMLEIIEAGKSKELPLLISSVVYPVTISWDLKSQKLNAFIIINGNETMISGSGSVQIPDQHASVSMKFVNFVELPSDVVLEQNYPNPFNPSTTLKYQLPFDSKVTLRVYNVLGQEVITLADEIQEAGYKTVIWNGENLASGVYFYRLDATSVNERGKSFTQVRKMLLLK